MLPQAKCTSDTGQRVTYMIEKLRNKHIAWINTLRAQWCLPVPNYTASWPRPAAG